MKRMEVIEKCIGGTKFYLKPFSAFYASNISGDLANLIGPILSAIAPAFGSFDMEKAKEAVMNGTTDEAELGGIMDAQIEEILPALSNALSCVSGEKIERMMMKLLISAKNISYEDDEDGRPHILDRDAADEIFCGNLQDMYILCFEVIKINFRGFFSKLGGRFGSLLDAFKGAAPSTKNTEN